MTRTRMALGLAAVCLAWAGAAVAGTDQEKWDAAIAKLAVPLGSFPSKLSKAFCVCNDPLDLTHAGQLETFPAPNNKVGVSCTVYSFNPDGSKLGASSCISWTPMAK